VSCCCEKLVPKAVDSSGTLRKGTSAVGSRYRATANENVAVGTVCVTVNCKVYSRAASKCPINPVISPKPRL
jgi:hypothetical protein